MNAQRMIRWMLAVAVGLALAALTVLLVALPTAAGPTARDWTPIPTPTPYPVDEVYYKLDTVGGDASPQIFPAQEVDGVMFGETTVETDFPAKMTFHANIGADSEIDRVNVLITYRNGAERALTAQWGEETQAWSAFWNLSHQIPAWAEFEFRWCARDTAGETVCTEPQPLTLVDPNQVWNRVTTDYAILYWYGFGEDQREDIARRFTRAVASTRPRLIEGFGRDISYKPIAIVYPDGESSQQVLSWGLDAGSLQNAASLGMAVMVLAPTHVVWEEFADCSLFPPEEWSMEYRLRWTLEADAQWGLVHLYLGDMLRRQSTSTSNFGWDSVNYGSLFWLYGQARWFTNTSFGDWPCEEHVQQVAAEYGIRSLLRMNFYSDYKGPDGCPGFLDDVGASFINWLVYTYGIETHRQIVELMTPTEDVPRGMDFEDAIEQATGKPFDELENEWRAYLELPPLE
jgi:hypothetical protein